MEGIIVFKLGFMFVFYFDWFATFEYFTIQHSPKYVKKKNSATLYE